MQKKVTLLHDWLTGFRGGERVLEAFCEIYPQADLHTLLYSQGSTSKIIENRPIHTSFLNSIPGVEKHYRKLLPLFPLAADSLKIADDTELVISSSHCVIKGVRKPANSLHISYIHSPMRYLYDQFDAYFGAHAPLYQQWGAQAFRGYLTRWDLASNSNVDYIIANSHFVQERIKKIYHRDSMVIHPFVELADFRPHYEQSNPVQDYYLMVTAFAPNKRVDIAVAAFNSLKIPLKIIGSGQLEKELRAQALPHVQFLGNLSRDEVLTHLRQARGFVFPGVEDFGITPLESLASGTPVIAYKAGGVLETLTADTSVFFTEATADSLCAAVRQFEKTNFNKAVLTARAEMFSKELFVQKFEAAVSELSSLPR